MKIDLPIEKDKRMEDENRERAVPFLESVANAYYHNFADMSEFCFVFPNKRAGRFFLKHLQGAAKGRTIVAPEVTSITDFVSFVSGHDVASRLDLLFRLYNIYRKRREEREEREEREMTEGRDEREEERDRRDERDGRDEREVSTPEIIYQDFDSFRNWGETLLSDFSEVDQYNVDADSLFKNVKDYREIASSFLTDEQIEVMVRYFGYAPGIREVERFWRNMKPETEIKSKFLMLWQQMAPLYHALNDQLHAEKLCTSGDAYRLALQRLKKEGKKILPWKKIVMVGFNALSTTEALIFEELKGEDGYEGIKGAFAEFFWDGTGPVLSGEVNDAATFLKYNRHNFPSPEWSKEWMERSDVKGMPPYMKVIAAPSNAAQGKVGGAMVDQLLKEFGKEEIEDAKVAVVLPDENLLIPFLYSIPESLEGVNLTMGYPLRLTSVISFIYHLRRVLSTSRLIDGTPAYYHEDLRLLLSHPYIHALIGSNVVSEILGYMNHHHKSVMTKEELQQFSMEITEVLPYFPKDARTRYITDWIDEVLVKISAALESKEEGLLKSSIDRSHIETYRDAVKRLANAAEEHDIEMGAAGVFAMLDKLIGGETVNFEGEALQGLQVMGLLETRALDFDRLIILSMNDKMMPRKASGHTFIPDSLRHGYGLPYSNYREDLFSYYFYRMISRAREVIMVYDARASSGMRSGGMSRYLMQLRYLYAPGTIEFENHKFTLSPSKSEMKVIEKKDGVLKKLEEFTQPGSKRNFSASALKNYFRCPVKFYYENVAGLRAENEPSEYIDAIGQGNVVHEVMLHLYFPEEKSESYPDGTRKVYLNPPLTVTAEDITAMMEDRERIALLVRQSINRLHFNKKDEHIDDPLDGASRLIAEKIEQQIEDVLAYDRSLAPFRLVGGEISGLVRWPLPGSDRKVNMKYAIDRLDIVRDSGDTNGKEEYRIVDYKTGSAGVKAKNMEEIFNASEDAKNFFQLMLYANLMNMDRGLNEPVRLSIYEISRLSEEGEVAPKMGKEPEPGKKMSYTPLSTHFDYNEEFMEEMDRLLTEIFDPDIPFVPADDDEKCQYCNLAHLCGRKS